MELGFQPSGWVAVLIDRNSLLAVGSRCAVESNWAPFRPKRQATFPAQAHVAAWARGARAQSEWAGPLR
jgi:hypothetical protein